jgi:L-fuculose-phosphate aldolase
MEMVRLGLVAGTSGNASMRLPRADGQERFLVTPTGKSYGPLGPADLVVVNGDLDTVDGDGVPSSESSLHLAVYRARPDVAAVMHTHSVYATALAVAGRPLPPVADEMVIQLGGQVDVAEYGFPGSEELAAAAVAALGDRRAVLLRNHGVCGVGQTPSDALRACALTERMAHVYLLSLIAGGAHNLPQSSVDAERAAYAMMSGRSV